MRISDWSSDVCSSDLNSAKTYLWRRQMKWSPDQSLQWLLPANRAKRWNDRDQVAATFDRRETQRPLSSTGPQRPERPTSGAKQPERQKDRKSTRLNSSH